MIHKANKLHIFLVILFGFCSGLVFSQENKKTTTQFHQTTVFDTQKLEKTPQFHEGLAGTYFGKHGSNFILAGGSHFPNEKPWQGGKKQFSKTIFVFQTEPNGNLQPIYEDEDLPEPMAEGAYVTLPDGLLCLGGQTPEGVSSKVFLISYNNGKITLKQYADLPIAVKSAVAEVIGNSVYLLGGQIADGSSLNQFLKLDLQTNGTSWEALPVYPKSVSGAAMVAQQNGSEMALFAFGGRNQKGKNPTDFYHQAYTFKPSLNQWISIKDIQNEKGRFPLAVANATKMGASSILLFGGDKGLIFNQVEQAVFDENIELRNQLWQTHTGFESDLLVYNTITDEWFTLGKTNQAVAVGSSFYDAQTKEVYIAGGEQKPGIRSPFITKITFIKDSHFGWLNYTVLALYFVGMLMLGFFFMKNNNNTDDYFKGGGRIPWWAAGISIFATMLSAITFISIPAKTYATDWRMLMFNMTIILAVPIIIRYFLPFFLRFKLDTAYEYLEKRFNRPIRWVASALFTFFMISRIAIVLFLPSLALNAVTGFNIYYAILIMSFVTIVYSTSGGMEAVVWGDVIQGFILVGGAIVAFIVMIIGIDGGLSEFWNTTLTFNKLDTFDFRLDFSQPVFWVVIFGGLANTLISYTSDQSVVQRYMSTVNEKATAKSIWLNGIVSVPVSILFFLLGTGLFAFYKSNPELMSITDPNIDSIFPQFIVSEMPMGMSGLLIASIFAAAMSTLSSNINSVSAVVTSDFYKTMFKDTSFKSQMNVARWSGILIGLLGTGMAIVLATWNIASLWDQFNTFLGLITSGLGALFILGIFFPRVSAMAAFIGLISGVLILYAVKAYTDFSFLLYGLIGMVSCIVVALLISFYIPNRKETAGITWKYRNS